jgi:hypothetical protein
MDDRKVFELKRLELAYKRQLTFMIGSILVALVGLVSYIYTIYQYDFQLLLVAVTLIAVGAISMFNIDSRMKDISNKIRSL